jgi:hypothetical protein
MAAPTAAIAHHSGDGGTGDRAGHHKKFHHKRFKHGHHHRFSVAKAAAFTQCGQEFKAIGKDAFKAKYGEHPWKACVKAHLPADRAAAKQCRAEKKASGKEAFKAKYGRFALYNCVLQATGTPTTT